MIQNGRRDKKHHRGDDRQRCRTLGSAKVIPFRGASRTTPPTGCRTGQRDDYVESVNGYEKKKSHNGNTTGYLVYVKLLVKE